MKRRLLPLLLLWGTPAAALQVTQITHQDMLYTIARVDLKTDKLQLHWRDTKGQPLLTFEALKKQLRGKRLLFATNSGIYAEGPRPLGLHIQGGKTLAKVNRAKSGGNFALLPNGIFWVKGAKAGVAETNAYLGNPPAADYATQSGPMLVIGGKLHPDFRKESDSFKLRSGVGVTAQGEVIFAISAGPVNFYQFATFFRDKLKCPNALYLDGSISAYYTPQMNTQLADFAGMWSVSR